jgi:hypothetical protein
MKKIICFCIGMCICADLVPAFADGFVSPTMELHKCRKISDREERNHCLAKWNSKKEEKEKKEQYADKNTGEISKEKCKQFSQSGLRTECLLEYKKQQRAKEQKKGLAADFTPPKKPELFLKIVPCEEKTNHKEKIKCFHDFHKELLEKEEAKKETTRKEEPSSPTLRLLECKKISDRTKRNDCYKNLREQSQEKKEERFAEEIQNFNASEEERKCLGISDPKEQTKCFHRFEQLKNRMLRIQESTFQPSDVRRGK